MPTSTLIWKWLEVGYNLFHVIVIDGKVEFNKKKLNDDNSLDLEAK